MYRHPYGTVKIPQFLSQAFSQRSYRVLRGSVEMKWTVLRNYVGRITRKKQYHLLRKLHQNKLSAVFILIKRANIYENRRAFKLLLDKFRSLCNKNQLKKSKKKKTGKKRREKKIKKGVPLTCLSE